MASRILSPGVYIQEESNPSLTATAENMRTVAVVGSGPSYIISRITVQHTSGVYTETIPGVAAEDIVSVVGLYLGDTIISASKYGITGVSVTWSDTVFADRLSQYTAILKVTKAATYYDATEWYVYDQTLSDTYGQPVVSAAINPIGAALYQAFSANAGRVIAVQAASNSDSDIKEAIDKLEDEQVDYIIVPEATSSTLQSYIKDHVDTQSSTEGMQERKAFVAPILITDSISTITAQAESFADERMWVVAPGGVDLTLSDGTTDYSFTASSIYGGAWLAGRLADPTKRIAKPITRETVSGVDSLNKIYKKNEKETLAGSGVLVLSQDAFGTVKVHQGLTTAVSNYNTREISIVNIKDEVRKQTRKSLDAEYIGQELDPIHTPAKVAASVSQILSTMIGTLIVSFDSIESSISSSGDAINVSFRIAVIRPFNYINITFKVTV